MAVPPGAIPREYCSPLQARPGSTKPPRASLKNLRFISRLLSCELLTSLFGLVRRSGAPAPKPPPSQTDARASWIEPRSIHARASRHSPLSGSGVPRQGVARTSLISFNETTKEQLLHHPSVRRRRWPMGLFRSLARLMSKRRPFTACQNRSFLRVRRYELTGDLRLNDWSFKSWRSRA